MGILRDLHQCAVIFCFNLVHVSRTCWCGNIKLQLFELGKIRPRCLRIVYEDLVHPPASVLFNQLWFSFAERPSPKAQAMFASILTPCLNPKTSAVVMEWCNFATLMPSSRPRRSSILLGGQQKLSKIA